MSKKWLVIAGIAALVVVALGAALLLIPRTALSPGTQNSGATSSATGTGSGTKQGQGATTTTTSTAAAGTTTSKTKTGGAGGAVTGATVSPLKTPFPELPVPKIPAQKPKSPAVTGQTLAPLTSAPDPTISALKLGAVPEGAQYTIVMRPLGIGPSMLLGSRLVLRVDSAKPVGKAPVNSDIVNANVLALVDTTQGGTVTKGGTYTATFTFRTFEDKMLPVLSKATVAK